VKIGPYDVDSEIPNLALMKLSAYHKEQGDSVAWFLPAMKIGKGGFDKVYASTVFKDVPDDGDRRQRMGLAKEPPARG
jgi:hypothetical protein